MSIARLAAVREGSLSIKPMHLLKAALMVGPEDVWTVLNGLIPGLAEEAETFNEIQEHIQDAYQQNVSEGIEILFDEDVKKAMARSNHAAWDFKLPEIDLNCLMVGIVREKPQDVIEELNDEWRTVCDFAETRLSQQSPRR